MEKDIGHTLNETQANKIRRPHYGKSSFVRWDNLVYVSTYVVESDPKTISLKDFLFFNQKYLTKTPKIYLKKKSTAMIKLLQNKHLLPNIRFKQGNYDMDKNHPLYNKKCNFFFISDTTETRHTLHTKRFELKNV